LVAGLKAAEKTSVDLCHKYANAVAAVTLLIPAVTKLEKQINANKAFPGKQAPDRVKGKTEHAKLMGYWGKLPGMHKAADTAVKVTAGWIAKVGPAAAAAGDKAALAYAQAATKIATLQGAGLKQGQAALNNFMAKMLVTQKFKWPYP
jgi:hypothetical protein